MKIRLLTAAVIAIILVISVVMLAGCGGNADPEARELLDQANKHLENAAVQMKKIEELNAKTSVLLEGELSQETIQSMADILEAYQKSMKVALDEVQEAKAKFKQVLNMNVSNDMKKYLKLKLQSLDEQETMLDIQVETLDLRSEFFNAMREGISVEEMWDYAKRIAERDKEAAGHQEKATAKSRDANEFYKEKNLDE